ncbi:MAG TPA: CheR family methyltransferase, partial [Spirochaetota bacterium]|nr:CheR family methyltransferase [Spirochaetota bacterium]
EPYSIAMTVFQYYKANASAFVKILATDIDTQVLSTAVNGEYKEDLISGMDQSMIRKYMIPGKEGSYRMIDEVKNIITFKRLNLLDPEYPMRKKFNCIFCRNVVIYFDKPTQKRLFEKFHDYLEDDGFLFVGHSENLSGLTDKFKLMGRTVYRKDL